ncbi:hypothetical protein FNV43_RR10512 [Rhamnella rubrinervis]|uniref:Ion transport domain-containing protein n=1 Tax=Rhamnella rubrinervis TaxID=2594499 RepID=A0A8K0H3W4_9ROSA|nr:hypothetical protein FNV43_RR10512 [Rhamnella rubrinervis]
MAQRASGLIENWGKQVAEYVSIDTTKPVHFPQTTPPSPTTTTTTSTITDIAPRSHGPVHPSNVSATGYDSLTWPAPPQPSHGDPGPSTNPQPPIGDPTLPQPSHGDPEPPINPQPPLSDPHPLPRVYQNWEYLMWIWAFVCSYGTPFVFGVYNDSNISIPVLSIMFDGTSTFIGFIDLSVEIWMWLKGLTNRGIDGGIWLAWGGFTMLRVLRMRRIFKWFQKKKHHADADYWRRFAYRALELILIFFFWLHLEGCVFHYLATIPSPPPSQCDSCATWLTVLNC